MMKADRLLAHLRAVGDQAGADHVEVDFGIAELCAHDVPSNEPPAGSGHPSGFVLGIDHRKIHNKKSSGKNNTAQGRTLDMTTTASLVTYERTDQIAVITLNRPEKLNAFTDDVVRELAARMRQFDTDPDGVRRDPARCRPRVLQRRRRAAAAAAQP